jgi:phenylalanyl-tRNA synthetase beta chain
VVEAIAREFAIAPRWEASEDAPFIRGRCARALTGDATEVGVFGEVDPAVLERFGLENPLVMAELSLASLAGWTPPLRFTIDE